MTTVGLDIIARNRASGPLDEIGDDLDRSGARWRRMGQAAKAGGLLAAAGLAAAAKAGYELAQSAAEDQLAGTRMATALRNRTDATDADVASVERWISAQGRVLGVTDDELRPAIAQLAAATGDIAEAQDDASLAMDVAAGRGVKLAVVTKALERAHNGSVAGLSRLGVQTKNAAGETMTLDQITRRLAETYRGQAAKSAQTAAGQYQRLKVFVTETGEAIGYTLLPRATAFAEFIQSRGVPALESYWQTFERHGIDGVLDRLDDFVGGQGRVQDVAGEVERSLDAVWRILQEVGPAFGDAADDLPAFLSPLKSIDSILGTVADGLEAIPDPVKELAVQAGIAAFVLPKLAAGVTAAGGAMTAARVQAVGYYTALRYGAAYSDQAAAASTRLAAAARTAAGVGGMLALTAAANDSNESLQVLGSIGGGALLGFSVGGPIGAAIGAGVGGLIALDQSTDDAAKAARTASVDWQTFAGSLDQTTGAINRQTRETVINNLAQSGLLEKAGALGINQRDLVNGILGETNARRSLRAQLVQQQQAADRLGRLQEEEASRPGGSRKRYAELGRERERRLDIIRAIEQSIGAEDRATESTATRLALINRIPKRLQLELQTNTPKTLADFAKLDAKMGGLSKRDLRVAIRLSGADFTVAQVRKVQDRLRETGELEPNFAPFHSGMNREMGKARRAAMTDALGINTSLGTVGRTRANTGPWQSSLADGLGKGRQSARRGYGDINELLGGAVSPANMDPYVGSVRGGVDRARGAASGAYGVGTALSEGVAAGVRARAAAIAAEAAGAVSSAITAARAAARSKSPSKETEEKVGRPLADGIIVGIRARRGGLRASAIEMVGEVVDSARRRQGIGLKALSDQYGRYVDRQVEQAKNARDALKAVEAKYNETRSTFAGAQGSVFSAPGLDDAGGVSLMSTMMYAAQQKDRAESVRGAIDTLIGNGISGSLLKRLRSEGVGGYDQILALAQADRAQIEQLNLYDRQTAAAYAGAAGSVNTALYGNELPRAQARADRESREARQAQLVGRELARALRRLPDPVVKVYIDGDELKVALRKGDNDRGRGGRRN